MPEQAARPVISTERVNGTAVFGAGGAQMRAIDHLVIDKAWGRIVHAVARCRGFLGLCRDHYPISRAALRYDMASSVYVTAFTVDQLQGATAASEGWASDRRWEEAAHSHFGLPFSLA